MSDERVSQTIKDTMILIYKLTSAFDLKYTLKRAIGRLNRNSY